MNLKDANARWRANHVSFGQRSDYKGVWDLQAQDIEVATLAVVGDRDKIDLEPMARWTIDQIRLTAGLTPIDVVLEIGCGIGRVGKVMSRECLRWVGTDISGNMLQHAKEYLADRPNVTLVELATVGLQEFPCDAFDLVYCTVVFMHLHIWDRFRYVEESFRILRPGGRCYFDNVPFDSEHGWKVFKEGADYPLDRRPAHMSMPSTREELRVYLERAGFIEVKIHELSNGFIAATGLKPDLT
jgi:SAM-dependent methyltransferase